MKLLEENIGGKLFDISLSDDFQNLTPQTKAKINKRDDIKLQRCAQPRKPSTK